MCDGRQLDGECVAWSSAVDVQCVAPKDSHCFAMGETSAKFSFTRVFPPSAGQADVFDHSTRPLLDEAFSRGQNALIFAYGLTNSGKTYTMLGREGREEQGIIPRLVRAVIDRLSGVAGGEEEAACASATGALGSPTSAAATRPAQLSVVLSFLEIYNEKVLDLLSKDRRVKCEIQATAGDDGEVFVKGLREVEVRGVDEAFALLQLGQAARAKARTALNADSSRSHSVFCVKLVDASDGRVWSRMSIVDLAGSERTQRTKTESGDERRKEASSINNSLVTLGRCLEVLRANSRRKVKEMVPFRESALTRLFKDSLTGSGRTVMMVNVSQVHADYDETLHALRYASIAKEVTLVAKVDSRHDVAALKRAHKAKQKQKVDGAQQRPMHRVEEEDKAEEEEGEAADDEVEEDSEGLSEVDAALLDDDEFAPVRVHAHAAAAAELVDGREEEILEALNEMYRLKAQLVAQQTEATLSEQRVRDELTSIMDREAMEAEELSNRRLAEERERVTSHLTRRFEHSRQRTEEAQRQLEDRCRSLEGQLTDKQQQISQAEQRFSEQLNAHQVDVQEQIGRVQQQREQETHRLEEELSQAGERLQKVKEELLAVRASFDEERTALLAELSAGSAALTSLQQEVEAEREERGKRERKEKKEAEERERQREKELKAERKEAEKARKEVEKEKAKLLRDVELLKSEAEEEQGRLQREKEEDSRRAAEQSARVVATFDEERSQWKAEQKAEKAKQQRALERADADAGSERAKLQEAMAALSADSDRRLQAASEARQAEVAELTRRIAGLTQRVERLTAEKAEVEAARATEAAERTALGAQRRAEDAEREEERARRQAEMDELARFELLRAEYNRDRATIVTLPDFLHLLRSLLFPPAKPALAQTPLSTVTALSSVSAAVPVATFQAPPILPAAASSTHSAASAPSVPSVPSVASSSSAPASAKPGILKKTAKASLRDSMDQYLDGYDERLVQASLLSTTTAPSAAASSSLVRRGKERLSSALDALRFNSTRTAPASSLHHALNESRSVSLVSAAPLAAQQMAKGSVANDGALLSPKVQKVLSRSRRSRSKSRKGKENQHSGGEDIGHHRLDSDEAARTAQAAAATSKGSRKAAPHPPAAVAASLPPPLSDAAQFDRLMAAEGGQAKYSRNAAAAPQQPPPLPATVDAVKPKMPALQPTPVAKRTRQHSHATSK